MMLVYFFRCCICAFDLLLLWVGCFTGAAFLGARGKRVVMQLSVEKAGVSVDRTLVTSTAQQRQEMTHRNGTINTNPHSAVNC